MVICSDLSGCDKHAVLDELVLTSLDSAAIGRCRIMLRFLYWPVALR